MALADPQSVTYATVATDLPRIGQGLMEGKFRSADSEFNLTVTHTANSRYRHSVQLRMDDITSNPLIPDQNIATFATVGLTINAPKNGYTNAQVVDLANALVDWLTPTIVAQLVTGES
jgi:hypothetical protein